MSFLWVFAGLQWVIDGFDCVFTGVNGFSMIFHGCLQVFNWFSNMCHMFQTFHLLDTMLPPATPASM